MNALQDQLPEGWKTHKLGEVSNIFNGNSISAEVKKAKYLNVQGGTPYIGTKDVGFDNEIDYENGVSIPREDIDSFRTVPKKTALICVEGGSAGRKIGFTTKNICFGNKLFALVPSKELNSKYIYYFLFSDMFQNQFKENMTGIIGGVSKSRFQNIKLNYPNLTEQQRIVSILDRVFSDIERSRNNAGENLQNAKELFESSLQTIFIVKGKNWNEKLLGEIATFRNGINYTKGSQGEKIQIVGVKDFQNSFWVPTENLNEVTIDGKLNKNDLLKERDILAVRSNGNPQLIGRTLLASKVKGQISHSGFTIRIRLNSQTVLPNYLCHYLKTKKTRKELVESGNGVGIRSLNQGSLSSLKIPYPVSIKEQEKIVRRIELIAENTQKLETLYQKKIDALDELKKSILQKAMHGELISTSSITAENGLTI